MYGLCSFSAVSHMFVALRKEAVNAWFSHDHDVGTRDKSLLHLG